MGPYEIDTEALSAAIRQKREDEGLNYRQAGWDSEITHTVLHKIETQQSWPDIRTYLKLVDWLGKGPAPFTKRTGK